MPLLRRRWPALFALGVASLFFAAVASGQAAVLSDGTQLVELTPMARFAPGAASFSDIIAQRVPFSAAAPHGSRVTRAWIRVPIAAQPGSGGPWVISLPRTVVQGEAYVPEGNVYRRLVFGTGVPFSQHTESYASAGITVDRSAALSGKPIYLHIVYHTDAPLWVRAQTLRDRLATSLQYRLFDGIFFGVMLAIGFCFLYVALALGDRGAAWFVAYVGTLVANELVTTGVGNAYLWPGFGLDARWPSVVTNILAFGTFLGFTRTFLQTRTAARAWDRLLIASFFAVALSGIAQYVWPAARLASVVLAFEGVAMIVTLSAALVRMRAGYHPARFFVAAFVPAIIGISANLSYLVFAPAGNWFYAENGVEFGAMFECVILSFSLLDRIRILDLERAQNQAELQRTAQRNTELKTLATRDPLTGISNRLAFFETFEDEIEYARRTGLLLGVLYIDLDGFKDVNDRYGHRVGDIMLQIFSRRLKNAVRPSDTVARLGGDEFAVLVTGVTEPSMLDAVQENVVRILDTHVVIEGALIAAGMSVGVAIFPRDGNEADELIEAADHRMYHAKQAATQAPVEEDSNTSSPT